MDSISGDVAPSLPAPREARPAGELTLGRRRSVVRVPVGGKNPLRLVAPFGTSSKRDSEVDHALRIQTLVSAGADCVQELSTHGEYWRARDQLVESCPVPYATVLAYEVFDRLSVLDTCTQQQADRIAVETLKDQAASGIDYVTIHGSQSQSLMRATDATRSSRVIPVPSRSAVMIGRLTTRFGIENPLHSAFGDLLTVCLSEGLVVSLGSSQRPAAIADALDKAHILELQHQGRLCAEAHEMGVDVLLEGLSHAVPQDLDGYVRTAAALCPGVPVTALGPLPTDIAVGQDHIAAAIGVMFASLYGIALVNIVSSKEHVAMPDEADMVDALRAARVGLHVAELIRQGRESRRDRELSRARQSLDWGRQGELAIDSILAQSLIAAEHLSNGSPCTICKSKCPFVAVPNVDWIQ